MCGRYQRRADKQRIAEAFQLGDIDGLFLELAPDFNVAPRTMQPVVVWDAGSGTRTLQMMFWRFLPPFCSDPKTFKLDTINANADKLMHSSMWRESFLHNRCLIPADSFVEWKQVGPKTKIPYLFALKSGEPFALGGVWRHWRAPDGKGEMDTFAIITTEPNELIARTTGHDRMPLIVKRADYQRWLQPDDANRPPIDLMRPYDAEEMTTWRADQRLNNVRNNDPSLIEPMEDRAEGQLPMFGS
jgi:putative SOS response-associated peptidase YedK